MDPGDQLACRCEDHECMQCRGILAWWSCTIDHALGLPGTGDHVGGVSPQTGGGVCPQTVGGVNRILAW
jgi:hypothetical protein